MPERIVQYTRDRYRLLVPEAEERQDDEALNRVLSILRARTGNDFAAYKKSTIRRRIERRMTVQGLATAAEYAHFLEQAPYEVDALFREVLITVTSFFRDPDAFAVLGEELLHLVEQKPDDGSIRGWIAGCASGEEAYSIAILIKEALQRANKNLRVQIFATDLDQEAIETARSGRFPEGIAADVSAERLQRYFTKEDSGYQVNEEVRELLVFASQNVIKDPPFTKLDFVSCRNLLIYLEPELQRRVLALFGYALNSAGLLLLGTSESIAGLDERFETVDKKWKVFRHRDRGPAHSLREFPATLPHGAATRSPPIERASSRATLSIGPVAERVLLNSLAAPSAPPPCATPRPRPSPWSGAGCRSRPTAVSPRSRSACAG